MMPLQVSAANCKILCGWTWYQSSELSAHQSITPGTSCMVLFVTVKTERANSRARHTYLAPFWPLANCQVRMNGHTDSMTEITNISRRGR